MTTRVRTDKLDLRISPQDKQTLISAAAAARQPVSEFVLRSALAQAEETLADRHRFGLSADDWDAFQAALDAPTRSLPRIETLFAKPSVFETDDSA
ncbi:MAG TPA: DUF1778 domain-containing protein [Thermomicrobiales bacterium]|nr:DUF1778 domain-containing protein [Thermomicrobiales bacterium]HRA48572.1 DUF1778 domain-containing protein [Thermomicrobiales bacterium]